jgi:hypothetical protein
MALDLTIAIVKLMLTGKKYTTAEIQDALWDRHRIHCGPSTVENNLLAMKKIYKVKEKKIDGNVYRWVSKR